MSSTCIIATFTFSFGIFLFSHFLDLKKASWKVSNIYIPTFFSSSKASLLLVEVLEISDQKFTNHSSSPRLSKMRCRITQNILESEKTVCWKRIHNAMVKLNCLLVFVPKLYKWVLSCKLKNCKKKYDRFRLFTNFTEIKIWVHNKKSK